MTSGARRVIRYGALATVIAATTAGILAWRVYPKEVAAWFQPDPRVKRWKASTVSLLGGPEALQSFQSATRGTAMRLSSDMRGGSVSEVGEAATLTEQQVRDLVAHLTDYRSYAFDLAKSCVFRPSMQIVLESDTMTHTLIICYSCDIITFDPGGGEDVAAGPLRKLAKELFPGDLVVQGIDDEEE